MRPHWKAPFLLALDQGTTSSRAVVFDAWGRLVAIASEPLPQHYPQPGWVEHDPREIWDTQMAAARQVLADAEIMPRQVAAVGIANQRETTLVWDRRTGEPLCPAIVWQCRRTAPQCEALAREGWGERVRERTGLVLDAYFSATKLQWLLRHVPGLRARARQGQACFGTVDSWLLWRLTGGKVHATDPSNASRTMLFDIHRRKWDEELLGALDIPADMLPAVLPSSGLFGHTEPGLFGKALPIMGVAGDQQAALFGQACFEPGQAKNTYGTGCFLLMNTGSQPVASRHGLLTTIAWGLGKEVEYALEGSVFVAGAAVQWLRDELGIIASAAETECLAAGLPDNGGVYLVPAFAGLGAPHWDMYARGTIVGLTRGTGRAHLARAALEAICYQSREVLEAMEADAGRPLPVLRVDGGAAGNDFLLQFQSDLLGVEVQRPAVTETTALGAACLAGLAAGVWEDRQALAAGWRCEGRFRPSLPEAERERLYAAWREAVSRARGWGRLSDG